MFKHHMSHIALSVPDAMTSRVLMFWLQGHTEQTPPKTYTCQLQKGIDLKQLILYRSNTLQHTQTCENV